MRVLISLGLMISMILLCATASRAQEDAGIVELHLEAIAGGVTLRLPAGGEWSAGVELSGGKHLGVDLLEAGDDLDLIGAGYAIVTWRPDSRLQISLGPIGFAGVVGNDFAAFYPSACLGADYFRGNFGLGTGFRLVRIAGANGTGDYWMRWSVLRACLRI